MEHARSRLVDEFRAEAERRGVAIDGQLEESIGGFADLEWSAEEEGVEGMMARLERDPTIIITGHTRWVVFSRILGEIRYYAAPLPVGGDRWVRASPERKAAIESESEYAELAILPTVADAVTLAAGYLAGKPLREIGVPRITPPWNRPRGGDDGTSAPNKATI
ncbi:MAG TPA: hypothetical protein VF092_07890 [Longimicrobium sp.]